MRWILSWMSSKGTINTLQWRQITCIYVYGTFGKWIKKLNKKNVYWCNHFSLQNVFFCNSETTTGGCSIKKAVWETSQNLPKKTPVLESPFNKVVGLKASFPEGIFKNTFYTLSPFTFLCSHDRRKNTAKILPYLKTTEQHWVVILKPIGMLMKTS